MLERALVALSKEKFMKRFYGCRIDEVDCMAKSIEKETRLQLATLLLRLFDELDSEIAARTLQVYDSRIQGSVC